jgi:hypothetical protein
VILVHGIRSFGQWQERFSTLLEAANPEIKVICYKYGWFSILSFLIPLFRQVELNRFIKYLGDQLIAASETKSSISVVAHSFGTHLLGNALSQISRDARFADLAVIDTVLLAGSVLPARFPWYEFLWPRHFVRRVVNQCGSRDLWPLVAGFFVVEMGASGRYGFQGPTGSGIALLNYQYRIGHRGFFTQEHRAKFLLPFVDGSPDSAMPSAPAWKFRLYARIESFLTWPKIVLNVALLSLVLVIPTLVAQHYRAKVSEAELSVQSSEISRKLDKISAELATQPEDALLEASRALRSAFALFKQAQRVINDEPALLSNTLELNIAEIRTRAYELFQTALTLANARAFRHKTIVDHGSLRLLVPNQHGDRVVIALRSSSTSDEDADESVLVWSLRQMTTTMLNMHAAYPTSARVTAVTFTEQGNVLVGTSANCVMLYNDSGILLMHWTEGCGANDGIVFGTGIDRDDGLLVQGADGTVCILARTDISSYQWPKKMRLPRVERSFWSRSGRYVALVTKWGISLIDSKMGNLTEYYPMRNEETLGVVLGLGSVFFDQEEKRLFVVVGEGRALMLAIEELSLKPLWETLLSMDDVRVGGFSEDNSEVEVITRAGRSIGLDAATGKKRWERLFRRQSN